MKVVLAGNAYIKALCNRALESSGGIVITYDTKSEALALRAQIHSMRAIERRQSRKMYEGEDPRAGKSAFDTILVSIAPKDGAYEVTLHTNTSMLQSLRIKDAETGETINPEELI